MNQEEKRCKNPKCNRFIKLYENPKKIFCSIKCKNRFHYLKDCDEHYEIIQFEKKLKKNYSILLNFFNKGVYTVGENVAASLGFDKEVFLDIEKIDVKESVYDLKRIKDIHFDYISTKNVIVIYKVLFLPED